MRVHLYNPNTDTHYANGGFISKNSDTPFVGGVWIDGPAPDGALPYVEITPEAVTADIKGMVAGISPTVLMRYPGEAALIGQFLEAGNVAGATALLTALHQAMNDASDADALTAIQPIMDYLANTSL
jgi:hypothetical protein